MLVPNPADLVDHNYCGNVSYLAVELGDTMLIYPPDSKDVMRIIVIPDPLRCEKRKVDPRSAPSPGIGVIPDANGG